MLNEKQDRLYQLSELAITILGQTFCVPSANKATYDVVVEQMRIVEKFGIQTDRSITDWNSILGEEFGEACQAGNDAHFAKSPEAKKEALERYREEMVQVAAVALTIINYLDT